MNNLKVLRAKKDVSQQQLSQVLGVSQNTISSWETSSTRPSAKNMLKMADYFDISLEELYSIFLSKNTKNLIKDTNLNKKYKLY